MFRFSKNYTPIEIHTLFTIIHSIQVIHQIQVHGEEQGNE